MATTVAVLTRDLRLRDNPALAAAAADRSTVVPLFVLDPRLLRISANRHRFLLQCLDDLRSSLRTIGGDLVIRHGDPVRQAARVAREVGASRLVVAADVSPYAHRREAGLRTAGARAGIAVDVVDGSTLVPPGRVRPGGGAATYMVFTPYYRAWQAQRWRDPVSAPGRLVRPAVDPGDLPTGPTRGLSPDAVAGGESVARHALDRWLSLVDGYADAHDQLAADRTSRLSPYLRFGCLSVVELAQRVARRATPGAEAYLRQLCWRDFYYQVASANPGLATTPLRASGRTSWVEDPAALADWQEGRTGVPIVDAGMRQLRAEGWMHNRARLVVGDYLTKHLSLDWRAGASWFERWLLDGDLPNNYGNWQWVGGVGNDTRPGRRFSPQRQAERFDPDGEYVRHYADG